MAKADRKPSAWSSEALSRVFGAALPEQLFYLILQACRRRDADQTDGMRGLDVSVPKWRAMAVIRQLGAGAMTEIAHLSAVDRTTLTRTIDLLVEDGLVERMASPTDRRLILLKLSPAGVELVETARQINRDYNARMLEGIPEEHRRIALAVMQKIVDNMIEDDDVAYGVLTFGHTSKRAPES